MASNEILRAATQLYNVSHRLDSLAEQHTLVSEALITISRSVRNTATLIGGAGCNENKPLAGLHPAND